MKVSDVRQLGTELLMWRFTPNLRNLTRKSYSEGLSVAGLWPWPVIDPDWNVKTTADRGTRYRVYREIIRNNFKLHLQSRNTIQSIKQRCELWVVSQLTIVIIVWNTWVTANATEIPPLRHRHGTLANTKTLVEYPSTNLPRNLMLNHDFQCLKYLMSCNVIQWTWESGS